MPHTKLLIPCTADQSGAWDTQAARCQMSRVDWIQTVLGHVCELNPAPSVIEPEAKSGKPGATRVNVPASGAQWAIWNEHAQQALMPVATWARLLLTAATDAAFARYMRRRFTLAEQCATSNRVRKT